jgi:hypothetical protein
MLPPNLRAALRVGRDFGLGVVGFAMVAGIMSSGQSSAYARPGAALAQGHTVISLHPLAPSVGGSDVGPALASAYSAFEPVVTFTGAVAPTHPVSMVVVALTIGALTALNLAMLRHMRQAYAPIGVRKTWS